MKFMNRQRTKPHIDMTPLIDCVFTMLVVLMLSATFNAPETIKLRLPEASTKDPDSKQEILLSVDSSGRYHLDDQPIDSENLVDSLRPLIERSSTKIVTFRGDEKAEYQTFVRALDAVRAAGGVHMNVLHK